MSRLANIIVSNTSSFGSLFPTMILLSSSFEIFEFLFKGEILTFVRFLDSLHHLSSISSTLFGINRYSIDECVNKSSGKVTICESSDISIVFRCL